MEDLGYVLGVLGDDLRGIWNRALCHLNSEEEVIIFVWHEDGSDGREYVKWYGPLGSLGEIKEVGERINCNPFQVSICLVKETFLDFLNRELSR